MEELSSSDGLCKIKHYRFDENDLLGKGEFGKVYRCLNEVDKKEYAMKRISLAKIKKHQLSKIIENNIESEVFLLTNLIHRNIVRLYDSIKTDDDYFLILEYCDSDLEKFIEKHSAGYVSEQKATNIMIHVLEGFKVLVANSVLHLDIKPANILISKGIPKIGDFGLSKVFVEEGECLQ